MLHHKRKKPTVKYFKIFKNKFNLYIDERYSISMDFCDNLIEINCQGCLYRCFA